jgi:hypothetical protein
MLQSLIAAHLTSDDDPDLWEVVTKNLLAEAAAASVETEQDVYSQIGCCHHWISPHHPIRWVNGGGFAWPFGYDKTTTGWSYRALPELSWSESFIWTGASWNACKLDSRSLVFRIAVPARTSRHMQAAIHTIWTPHSPTSKEKVVQLFGYRKTKGSWIETASDEIERRGRKTRFRRQR